MMKKDKIIYLRYIFIKMIILTQHKNWVLLFNFFKIMIFFWPVNSPCEHDGLLIKCESMATANNPTPQKDSDNDQVYGAGNTLSLARSVERRKRSVFAMSSSLSLFFVCLERKRKRQAEKLFICALFSLSLLKVFLYQQFNFCRTPGSEFFNHTE